MRDKASKSQLDEQSTITVPLIPLPIRSNFRLLVWRRLVERHAELEEEFSALENERPTSRRLQTKHRIERETKFNALIDIEKSLSSFEIAERNRARDNLQRLSTISISSLAVANGVLLGFTVNIMARDPARLWPMLALPALFYLLGTIFGGILPISLAAEAQRLMNDTQPYNIIQKKVTPTIALAITSSVLLVVGCIFSAHSMHSLYKSDGDQSQTRPRIEIEL